MKAINRTKEELFEEVKDVPYELPEEWKWVKLGDIAKTTSGGTPSRKVKEYWENGTIPWVKSGELNDNYIEKTEEYITEEGLKNSNAKIFPKGTLLMAMYGATAGKTGILKINTSTNQAICAIFPNENFLDKNYLWIYLRYIRPKLLKTSFGGAQPNISQKAIRNILIPIPFKDGKPDLEKQKQIVEKIEALFKEIDKAIELRQKAIEETKKLFDSVLDKIFREAEKDKENWKWVKLKDVLTSLESGKRPKGGAVENGIPSIGGEHLNNDGSFNFHKMKYIPEDFYKTMKKGKIQINDILVVKDGATTGKVSFVSKEFPYKKAAVNEHIFILRVKNSFVSKYVFWFLFSPVGQKEILQNFGGAAQGGINRRFVENVNIPIPVTKNDRLDLRRQILIAEYLDSIHNKVKQIEELQKLQLEKFKQLKESILSKAFKGELL
jgi:type I restriction enzyme S subunit